MEQVFTAASHDDVLKLLIQFVVLLFTARVLGELAQRLGQPTVVGEILAGILLGPSFLSGLIPFVDRWIVPQTPVQGYLLEVFSLLGILFLLLITGLETDLALIRNQIRSAMGVALGGLFVPLLFGFMFGGIFPEDLLVHPEDRLIFSFFLATAMAISAIPVIAKVLMDLNLTRRDVGQTIIAAAMIDDTTGWILLSIVIGLAGGQGVTLASVAVSTLSVLAFIGIGFTAGQWVAARLLRLVHSEIKSRDKTLTLVVLLAFGAGAISHALHFEALLGTFLVGILFSRLHSLDAEVTQKLESITIGILAPVFFAVAGLKVNVTSLLEPRLMLVALAVTAVATAGKVIGVYVGARSIGKKDHWTALFLSAGLNARGSMGIIVASIGLSLGVLTQDTFSMIVLMAVITSLLAPFVMRWALGRIEIEQEELDRLRREEINKENIIANTYRVLLPVRPRSGEFAHDTQTVEARILEQVGSKSPLEVTLFTVSSDNDDAEAAEFLEKLSRLFARQRIIRKVAPGDNPAHLILEEVNKNYDLLVLGATDRKSDPSALFTPIVDTLTRLSPCPTIVVHGERISSDWSPRRILVPTNGSAPARRAAEVAFSLASRPDAEVIILKVVEQRPSDTYINMNSAQEWNQFQIAEQIVGELRKIGETLGVQTAGQVQRGRETSAVIMETARRSAVDLIVLGTNVRPGSDRLYLGPKVEHILNEAPCPVIVVNSG